MSWGEIYNTSWWGIALDTARTVKARPDFFGSQLNLLTSEQPNLVVNGTFDTDSDWSFGTGWSMGDGKAVAVLANNTFLQQNQDTIADKTYKVVYTVSDYQNGNVRFQFSGGGGNTIGTSVNANGTYTEYIKSTLNHTIYRFKGTSADGGFTGSIDNVSVQLVRAELDQIEAKKCLADWIHTTALKDLNN
jgi:hypothetical protein